MDLTMHSRFIGRGDSTSNLISAIAVITVAPTGKALLCLKLRADEAFGSIQWTISLVYVLFKSILFVERGKTSIDGKPLGVLYRRR